MEKTGDIILRRQGMRNVEGVIMEKRFFQTNNFLKIYVRVDSLRVKLQCYLVVIVTII